MKTSILISVIAICLGLRSLANVIPPSIRGPSRGAIFRRQNMSMYPFSRISHVSEIVLHQLGRFWVGSVTMKVSIHPYFYALRC